MSRFQRAQHWSTFARSWWLYDARWQNPFKSAHLIGSVLCGKHKPIYHPSNDVGDHVVVINSKHVALLGREWQLRVYFHDTGLPKTITSGGKRWVPAWQMHRNDPTVILWKACYGELSRDWMRRQHMARLHVFPDEEVPEDILSNVSHFLRQERPVAKHLEQYTQEERDNFPKISQLPPSFVANVNHD